MQGRIGWPLILGCVLGASPGGGASAQVDSLPCSVASAQRPDGGRIRRFATAQVERLRSDDAAERQAARDELLAPFRCPASLGFRLEYAAALAPSLGQMVQSDDDNLATIAVHIAGQCATAASAEVIRAGLVVDDALVRTASAVAARRALLLAQQGQGGLRGQGGPLIASLGAALEVEQDPVAVEEHLAALTAASGWSETSTAGVQALSLGFTRWVRARRDRAFGRPSLRDSAYPVLAGMRALSDTLIQPEIAARVTDAQRIAAAAAAGQALAYARDRLQRDPSLAGPDAERARAVTVEALNQAKNLLIIVEQAVKGQGTPPPPSFGDLFAAKLGDGADERFTEAAEAWIGPGGVLTRAPYNHDPAAFAPRPEPAGPAAP